MKIPMDVITELLEDYQPSLLRSSTKMQYSKVRLVQNSEFEFETLYIGYGKDITSIHGSQNSGFITIGKPVATPNNLIIVPDTSNLHDILNFIQNIFDSFHRFEFDLIKSAGENSYQNLIETGYRFTENPVFLLENGYRVVAMAPDIDIPNDYEWDHLRKKRFMSIEAIKSLKKAGFLDTMNSFDAPTLFSSPYHPFSSIIANLYINAEFTGMLVITQAFKTFSHADFFAAKIMSGALELIMKKDETLTYIRKKRPINRMLHDLVNGLNIDNRLIMEWLQQYLPTWTNGLFRILFIPLSSTQDQTFDFYSKILEKKVDVSSFFFANALVAVLHYPGETDFQSIKNSIASFLSDNALSAGLSNEFRNLSDLQEFYQQAEVAFEFGKGGVQIHLYCDYMLNHILSFCSRENILLLCHDSVIRLKQVDIEKNTEYFKTLHIFIKNERSLKKTSQELFIHRNTLIYRLDKIRDMLNIDLDSADTRLHILLSYKLLENRSNENNLSTSKIPL